MSKGKQQQQKREVAVAPPPAPCVDTWIPRACCGVTWHVRANFENHQKQH